MKKISHKEFEKLDFFKKKHRLPSIINKELSRLKIGEALLFEKKEMEVYKSPKVFINIIKNSTYHPRGFNYGKRFSIRLLSDLSGRVVVRIE